MTVFQTSLLGAFVLFLIGGVAAFALFRGSAGENLPTVLMWGTLPEQAMFEFSQLESIKSAGVKFEYVQKNPASLENEFVEALASGEGPDLVILPHDLLLRHQNKLLTIPLNTLSERTFKDTFVEGGELFLTKDGALGIPIFIDPLVAYWNRNMLSGKGVSLPPKYWDEFLTMAPKFNEKNNAGNLRKTLVALGETINISHFKDILSILIIQAGNPITERDKEGKVVSVLSENRGLENSPTEAALRFYTEFSNPVKPAFSWNKSLPNSRDAFTSEQLGIYFGFGSELQGLHDRNPNINFDVTTLPQIRDGKTRVTYGRMYALVIPKASRKAGAAISTAVYMIGSEANRALSELANLPPARRDLLATPQKDAYKSVFYTSAVMARAWLDPSPTQTSTIFRDIVEGVISGKSRLSEAVNRGNGEIDSVIKSIGQ